MRRTDSPELKRQILQHLAHLYKIDEVREPNHLSSYVYCRTKLFLSQKTPSEPTDEEVMLFALGYGLQDVLTPKEMTAPVYERFGIVYRPDMSFTPAKTEVEQLMELKTTRKSAKYHYMDDALPDTWLDYMKGGCYIRGTSSYDLVVLYMMGNFAPPFPQMYCDHIEFTEDELLTNWDKIMQRKLVADRAFKTGVCPTPFQNCYDWECKYCRFKLVCESIVRAESYTYAQIEKDKELWK